MTRAGLQRMIDKLESPSQRQAAQHHLDNGDDHAAALVLLAPRDVYARRDRALLVAFLMGAASQL